MKTLYWRSLGKQKQKTTTVELIIGVCGASHASMYFLSVVGNQCWDISFALHLSAGVADKISFILCL